MIDDFYSVAWVDHHARLGNAIARWLSRSAATVKVAFERLHAYQFDAPWRHEVQQDNRSDTNARTPEHRLIGWNW